MRAGRQAVAAALERGARLAFAALVVTMPFRFRIDPFPHPATDLPAPLSDVVLYGIDGLVVATIVLWLAARVAARRPIRLGPRALALPAAGLVVLGWLTLPFGVLPELSLFGAVRLSILVILAVYVLNEVRDVHSLAIPIGLMVGVQALVAIGQFATQGSLGLTGAGELRLDPSVSGVAIVLREDGARILRAYGLSPHPNVLGGFLAIGILLLLGMRPASLVGRILQAAVVTLGAAAVLVTFSRGAWLGLGSGLVAGVIVLGARTFIAEWRRWLAIGGLAVAVLVVGAWQLRGELAARTGLAGAPIATEQRSVDERVAQIELGWRVFAERPLSGAGMSAVPVEMERLDPAFTFSYYPPHLVPLVIAAELGIGGALAILALLAAPWILLARIRPRWNRELATASAALAALMIAGLFDDYPWVGGPGRTLFWVTLGLWAAAFGRSAAGEGGAPT